MSDAGSPRKPWTLGRMYFQLDAIAESYILAHSLGYGEAGHALVSETDALGDPAVMMLAREQYALFRFLAAQLGCTRALDVGTFTGLSALAFAEGMKPHGRVTTIDRDPAWIEIARKHWKAGGVDDRIDVVVGEAGDVLRHMQANDRDRFDIVFLDVDKARIREYFEAALALITPRGLVMVDNTFWHGWIFDPDRTDPDTEGMRQFNEDLAGDSRVEVVMLPIADGLTMVRRR